MGWVYLRQGLRSGFPLAAVPYLVLLVGMHLARTAGGVGLWVGVAVAAALAVLARTRWRL